MMLAPAKISAQEGCDVLPHCADNGMDLGTNLPFYYVIFPNGDNTFDIYLRANFCINTEPEKYEWCYTIMHNGVGEYVETGTMDVLGGAGIAEFLHVPDLCDRTVFFTVRYGTNMPYYNCKRLPCPPKEECNRCELKYPYYTDVQTVTGNSSTWFLCDGWIDPNENIVPHDFINVNTYPGIGVPDDDDKIVFTDNNCHTNPDEIIHRIYFPPGIWVADDCEHHGDATVIANTLDPSLLVFPVLHYSGMRIAVEGSVQMSLDYNFDNCDICMHEGARIVSTSTNLQFTNQTLVHDVGLGQPNPPCDFKGWYAIVIQSGKVTASNSRFTGAYAALTRETGQAGTPQVNLQWCTFDRNYTSMAVRSPLSFQPGFSNNTFGNATARLDFPGRFDCSWLQPIPKADNLQPFAGIYASNGVNIGFPGTATGNLFAHICNGIYLDDASGNIIRGSRFWDMENGFYPGATGDDDGRGIVQITANVRTLIQRGIGRSGVATFNNCRQAVVLALANGNVQLDSRNNLMTNVGEGYSISGNIAATLRPTTAGAPSLIFNNTINYTGIDGIFASNLTTATDFEISRNRITTAGNGTGIYILGNGSNFNFNFTPIVEIRDNTGNAGGLNQIEGGNFGVKIENTGNVLVRNNRILNNAVGGVRLEGSDYNRVQCNVVTGLSGSSLHGSLSENNFWESNNTNGNSNGLEISGVNSPSTITCNIFQTHTNGVSYGPGATTGAQGSFSVSNGNRWTGTYSPWAANAPNPPAFQPNLSFYFVTPVELPNFMAITTPPGWFSGATTSGVCPTGCPEESNAAAMRQISDLDRQFANNDGVPEGLTGYLLRRNLYTDLLKDPALAIGEPELLEFLAEYPEEAGGRLADVEKSIFDAFQWSATQSAQHEQALADLDAASLELAALDDLQEAGQSMDVQEAQRNALNAQIEQATATIAALNTQNLEARQSVSETIQQALDGANAVEVYETNEKTLNDIYLNSHFVGVQPTSAQREDILGIGKQCSLEGGPAVIRARAWYLLLTGERITGECNGVEERSAPLEKDGNGVQNQLSFTPNPSREQVMVGFAKPLADGSFLQIVSVEGKLLRSMPLSKGMESAKIDVANWPAGIYICQLMDAGGNIVTSKFTVIP